MKCNGCPATSDLKSEKFGVLPNGFFRFITAEMKSYHLCGPCSKKAYELTSQLIETIKVDPALVHVASILNFYKKD